MLAALGLGALIALGAGLGAIVGDGGGRGAGTPTPSGGAATATTPDGRPDPVPALVERMSTERKVAQLFLWGVRGSAPLPRRLGPVAVGDLGGVVIARANYTDPAQLRALAASAKRRGRIRPLVMAVQRGGEFNALAGLAPATAPADLPGAAAGAREARAAGRALRPLGVTGVLAPTLDVGPPDGPAVGALAFSEDAADVSRYAAKVTVAYRKAKLFTAAGSFPGLGSASQPVSQGPANVGLSARELERRDVVPFKSAIEAGVPGIMVSNGLYVYDDFVTPGSLSRRVVRGLLRRKLGFQGVAVTGDLTEPAVTALVPPRRSAVAALQAGADLLYLSAPPADQAAAYRAVLTAVRRRRVSAARLNQAVTRVLAAKRDYGVLAEPKRAQRQTRTGRERRARRPSRRRTDTRTVTRREPPLLRGR